MREIRFRGKTTVPLHGCNVGDWVYGFYSEGLRVDGARGFFITAINGRQGVTWAVDPETVGQYVGRDDKWRDTVPGKDIYEDDIVLLNEKPEKNIVQYHGDAAGYVGVNIHESTFVTLLCKTWRIEVIGNKHDNPELMEDIK